MHTPTIFVLLAALACAEGPVVRGDVERGVRTSELAILLVAAKGKAAPQVEQIVVATQNVGRGRGSQGLVQWAVGRRTDGPTLPLPARIRYGEVPPGFGTTGPAPVLRSGSYELRVQAAGIWSVTPFRVSARNTIE